MIYLRYPLKYIKVYYWWNVHLKKNEFSSFLDLDLQEYLKKSKEKPNEYTQELVYRRELAHLLDDGHQLSDIFKNNYQLIKNTKL